MPPAGDPELLKVQAAKLTTVEQLVAFVAAHDEQPAALVAARVRTQELVRASSTFRDKLIRRHQAAGARPGGRTATERLERRIAIRAILLAGPSA
ncbi:hypothetical protein BH10ACT1_BH10ACT1_33320 [soil metagenome]